MKYILLHDIDDLSKNIIIKSYLDDDFIIISENDKDILLKKNTNEIIDEDIYIKILYSYLKRSGITKNSKGKIIDLSDAFIYASSKDHFDKFDNKFEWYVRNIINREINK